MKCWDKEKIYDEKLSPLIKQIISICRRNKMPLLICVAFSGDKEGNALATSCVNGFPDRTIDIFEQFIDIVSADDDLKPASGIRFTIVPEGGIQA